MSISWLYRRSERTERPRRRAARLMMERLKFRPVVVNGRGPQRRRPDQHLCRRGVSAQPRRDPGSVRQWARGVKYEVIL